MRTFITNTIVTGFGFGQVRVGVSVRNERSWSAARHLHAAHAAGLKHAYSGLKRRLQAMLGGGMQVDLTSAHLDCRTWRPLPACLRLTATI